MKAIIEVATATVPQIVSIPVEKLNPHPDNPRKKNLGDLAELAESIKVNGILQNLTVVPWFSSITYAPLDDPVRQAEAGYRYAGRNKNGLPPNYGKAQYTDMSTEEQAVVDSFQGEKEYAKVMTRQAYYLAEPTREVAMLRTAQRERRISIEKHADRPK